MAVFNIFKKKTEEYNYEFIPYKQIGNIRLDNPQNNNKIQLINTKHLNNVYANKVLCRPDRICPLLEWGLSHKYKSEKVNIIYNNKKINITSNYKDFTNSIKEICTDLIIKEDIDNDNKKTIEAYSKQLGIYYLVFEDKNGNYYISVLTFNGRLVFDEFIQQLSKKEHLENVCNDNNIEKIRNINKQYNVNLDYTIESINEVMNILDSVKLLFEKSKIDIDSDDLITTLGIYVGDTLLKYGFGKNGFKWTLLEEINNDTLKSFFTSENLKGPFVACKKGLIAPIDKVHKYWNKGKEDDLYSYCKVAIQHLDVKFSYSEDSKKFFMLL